jgi:asparagine synthetase B (glutamine-hydrolysing)
MNSPTLAPIFISPNDPSRADDLTAHLGLESRPGLRIEVQQPDTVQILREAFDTVPVYYTAGEFGVAASSSWRELLGRLRSSGVAPELDPHYLAHYLNFQCPQTPRTLCRQIRLLRAGERVQISRNRCDRIWIGPRADAAPATPASVEAELVQALARLDPDRTCFHLSAGLDSSLLVILATRAWDGPRPRVTSCRTQGRGASDELDLVEQLAAELQCELTIHDLLHFDVLVAARNLGREVLDYPIAHASHLTRYLLDQRIASRDDTVVTGRGPDEVLAGYPWHKADHADPNRHRARRRVTTPEQLASLLRPRCVDPLDADTRSGVAPLSLRERLRHDLRSITESWNVVEAGLARALGVRYVSPFLAPALQAQLFALPDEKRIHGGNQKWFLREAFDDLYPPAFLTAPKRGMRMDLQPYLQEHTAAEITTAILDSPLSRLLMPAGVRGLVEQTLSGQRNAGWQLWSLLLCAQVASVIECNDA